MANLRLVSRSLTTSFSFSISANFFAYAVCLTQYNLNIGAWYTYVFLDRIRELYNTPESFIVSVLFKTSS